MEIFSFEESHRKWRFVCRKFAECVPLRLAINAAPNSNEVGCILQMLRYPNCRTVKTNDWTPEAQEFCTAVASNKGLRAISIIHSAITPTEVQDLLRSSLCLDVIESWSFGNIDIGEDGMEALNLAIKESSALRQLTFDCCSFGEKGVTFGPALADNTLLHTLALKSSKLGPDDFKSVSLGVSACCSLTELNLSFTPLSATGCQVLGDCVGASASLRDLNIDFCNVGVNIRWIVPGFEQSRSLTACSLKGNQLGDEGASILARILPRSALRSLNLWDNGIHEPGAGSLGHAIETSHRLEDLQLGNNNLGDAGCRSLASGVAASTTFKSLGLAWNGVREDGACALAQALETNRSLRRLDLSHNQVGLRGAQALRTGMERCARLEGLDVEGNNFEDDAVAVLAAAILLCPTLQSINLSLVDIGPAGTEAVANALATSTSLTSLSLKHTTIDAAGAQALAAGLALSQSLRHLDLQGCSISSLGIQHFAEGVTEARKLESLNLMHNNIGEVGARALAAAISRAPAFRSLKVMYSELGPAGSQALMDVMQRSCTFNSLELNRSDVIAVPCDHDHPSVLMRQDPEGREVEVVPKQPFSCARCHHKLYERDPSHRLIIYCVDRAGIIQEVMTPEEWSDFAKHPVPDLALASTVVGRPLTLFMEHRLAGFYHTLCSLIWEGDLCHTQFQWYCDDPDHRREMLTFIYCSGDVIVFSNVTVSEEPHHVPVSFMSGKPDSLLWRCPFCGWSCCNGGDWMQPEEFYLWCMSEWPALMRDHDYYPVLCDECLREWVTRYDNPQLHEAILNLRPMEAGGPSLLQGGPSA